MVSVEIVNELYCSNKLCMNAHMHFRQYQSTLDESTSAGGRPMSALSKTESHDGESEEKVTVKGNTEYNLTIKTAFFGF
mgnify:CR=1 FL=1